MQRRAASLLAMALGLRDDLQRFFFSRRAATSNRVGSVGGVGGVGGVVDVNDKIHDVLVTVAERSETFQQANGDLQKWMFGIAANHERKAERARRRYDARFRHDEHAALGVEQAECPTSSPELDAHYRDLGTRMAAALRKLPPHLLEPLLLLALEDLSHEQIAERLHVSVALAKKRVQRAREQLRREMGITRDDLHSAMPLFGLFPLEEKKAPLLARIHQWMIGRNAAGNLIGVILLGCMAAGAPKQAERAMGGLSIHPLVATRQAQPPTAAHEDHEARVAAWTGDAKRASIHATPSSRTTPPSPHRKARPIEIQRDSKPLRKAVAE